MDPQGKPLTEQAKEAMAATGQKVGETWAATKATVAEVSQSFFFFSCLLGVFMTCWLQSANYSIIDK